MSLLLLLLRLLLVAVAFLAVGMQVLVEDGLVLVRGKRVLAAAAAAWRKRWWRLNSCLLMPLVLLVQGG